MRIAWFSNAPDIPTGYGVQTDQVTRRMAADGHDVHVLANFSHRAGFRRHGNVTIWPEGKTNYSLDVAPEWARMIDADVVFTLYDVWVMRQEWDDRRVISWTPVDHYPAPPMVIKWAEAHETIAMSEYGAEQFRASGVEPVAIIPHGVEDAYRPAGKEARRALAVPDDAFLVTINAANIGAPVPRKAWSENMSALALFMHRHPDAYVYLHTDMANPAGVPLAMYVEMLGIPRDRIRVAPPFLYIGGMIDDAEMAKLYSASDVLLAASKGEGFGVPVIEAMACGVPSIVSDFSAQPELVGDTGWKVPGQLDIDSAQGAFWFTPFVDGIASALEDAYRSRGTRTEACVERAKRFRADDLYATHWRPLLERLAAEQAPQPRPNRAARRHPEKAA